MKKPAEELFPRIPELLSWYREAARPLPWRGAEGAYPVWVSEIMLQQTRIEAVRPYYARFMEAYPTVRDLAEAPEEEVLKLWEGLGYYRRAQNLHRAAQLCCERYGGEVPLSFSALRELPGIGEYTAGAVASIAGKEAVCAVDGNVCRILARLRAWEQPVDEAFRRKAKDLLRRSVPEDAPGDFNQALMELGETLCIPKGRPLCGQCPLQPACAAAAKGDPERYPVPEPVKKRPVIPCTVLRLETEGKTAVVRRPEGGLLAGMYTFPMREGTWSLKRSEAWVREQDEAAVLIRKEKLGERRHVFSHVEWKMTGFLLVTDRELPGEWTYVPEEQLRTKYPFPAAMNGYLPPS